MTSDAELIARSLAGDADAEIWSNCLDALNAGAANQQVRAGVLRLLATVPQVTVSNTVTDGQPALTLAETFASPSGRPRNCSS